MIFFVAIYDTIALITNQIAIEEFENHLTIAVRASIILFGIVDKSDAFF